MPEAKHNQQAVEPETVKTVLERLKQTYPNARSELNYRNNFELLIAVILSAQTTDKAVNKVTSRLFEDYPDPESFLDLSQEELENYIRSIGLYRNKAKHILKTCAMLVEHHGGRVPDDYDSLIQLPGVGRKTANVVLSNAFDRDAIAVDTHVFRVSHRLGWSSAKTPLQTERDLQQLLPKSEWSRAHHLLIWHGRRICEARQPKCGECPVQAYCAYGRSLTDTGTS